MVTKKQCLELIVAVDIYLTPHEWNLCMVHYLETRKDFGTFSMSSQSHPSLLYVGKLPIKEGLGCVVPFSRDSIGGKLLGF